MKGLEILQKKENLGGHGIDSVVAADLCHGCGVCAGVCSKGAIAIEEDVARGLLLPRVDHDRCVSCGDCVATCPGPDVDFATLENCGGTSVTAEAGLGRVRNCHIAYASDDAVRRDASSGGVVTALLIQALSEGRIDGVLTTRMTSDDPFRPEVFVARTVAEIKAAAGSKYCPVALGTGLHEVLTGSERVAVVGLPCQIHGIRKGQARNKELRRKIVLCVGIFCGHTDNFLATPHILRQFGVDPADLDTLAYRGRGWPGSVRAVQQDGTERLIPYRDYIAWHERYFFTPLRCLTCADVSNRLSDVTVMDAWLPELRNPTDAGRSMVVTRTPVGDLFIDTALCDGALVGQPCTPADVWRSHGWDRMAAADFGAHVVMAKLTGRGVPRYGMTMPRAKFRNWLRVPLMWINAMTTRDSDAVRTSRFYIRIGMGLQRLLTRTWTNDR